MKNASKYARETNQSRTLTEAKKARSDSDWLGVASSAERASAVASRVGLDDSEPLVILRKVTRHRPQNTAQSAIPLPATASGKWAAMGSHCLALMKAAAKAAARAAPMTASPYPAVAG